MDTTRFSILRSLTGTLLIILLMCFACTSSQAPAPVRPQTRMELLTGGSSKTWRMVNYTKPGSSADIDKCLLDNLYIFSLSGEFINDDGSVRCLPGDNVRQLRGTWKFNADSTAIIISGAGMSISARVASLSGSTLVLEELSSKGGSVLSVSTFEAH